MNKFQRHIKAMPESSPSFQQAPANPPLGVTVITQGDGWVHGVTRVANPQIQQISRKDLALAELNGVNVRRFSIDLD